MEFDEQPMQLLVSCTTSEIRSKILVRASDVDDWNVKQDEINKPSRLKPLVETIKP